LIARREHAVVVTSDLGDLRRLDPYLPVERIWTTAGNRCDRGAHPRSLSRLLRLVVGLVTRVTRAAGDVGM
jgi:hypothetical protein